MLDGGDFVYDAIRRYAAHNISYVHFRNVVGKAPNVRAPLFTFFPKSTSSCTHSIGRFLSTRVTWI